MLMLAAVVPHGDEIVEPKTEEMKKLNIKMRELGKRCEACDLYIIISPHNLRVDTHIAVILTEYLRGVWTCGNTKIEKELRSDRYLAKKIYDIALDNSLPVIGVNFGALEGEYSCMPLDWGTLIPLHFIPDRKTVLITPARNVKRVELVKFGELLGDIIQKDRRKICLLVSADQAHAHAVDGPYGFSDAAEKYDEEIVEILRTSDFEKLLDIPEELVENALPDSYWQLLILLGVAKKVKMRSEFVEYGVAHYFGMAVSILSPVLAFNAG